MTIELFKRLNEGDRDSASEQNRLRSVVEGLTNFSGPRLTHSEAGTAYSPPDAEHFTVKLTAVTNVAGKFAYSWTEQQDLIDGSFIDKPGGLSGTSTYLPLFERNNVGTVAVNTIVEAAQGTGLFFLFDKATAVAGSLTVEEVDGSPSVTGVTTIDFDQADGFTVTNSGGGVARIDMAATSSSGVGIVNVSAQTLGRGVKAADGFRMLQNSAGATTANDWIFQVVSGDMNMTTPGAYTILYAGSSAGPAFTADTSFFLCIGYVWAGKAFKIGGGGIGGILGAGTEATPKTFTTVDGKTVTVIGGIITSVV